jgi:hypothetical protein
LLHHYSNTACNLSAALGTPSFALRERAFSLVIRNYYFLDGITDTATTTTTNNSCNF